MCLLLYKHEASTMITGVAAWFLRWQAQRLACGRQGLCKSDDFIDFGLSDRNAACAVLIPGIYVRFTRISSIAFSSCYSVT